MHVVVIVLGDIGRSPRMQYHTRSLLESGCYVTLVGYEGESLIPPLEAAAATAAETDYGDDYDGNRRTEKDLMSSSSSRLKVVRFTPYTPPKKLFKPLYLLLRLLGLLYGLLHALFIQVPRGHNNIPVDCVLVQNPPSIPLLLIAYLYCHLQRFYLPWRKQSKRRKKQRRPGLVIDWHNLGYTMFDLPDRHPIRLLAHWYERLMAPRADGHLAVTTAMKLWLEKNFGLQGSDNISVLHDKPPEFFRPTTNLITRHELMIRLDREFRNHCPDSWFSDDDDPSAVGRGGRSTLFTEETTTEAASEVVTSSGGGSRRVVQLRSDRPMLVISSTSWTPDEDFGVLLDACVQLDTIMTEQKQQRENNNNSSSSSNKPVVPNILIIVTGKGPQKSMYETKISQLNLVHVRIVTLWLEAEVYPILLGCADLGISLHTSTSGIDLPMKVLDMFGCQVPVLARNFTCLNELVEDGKNGRVFDTSTELSNLLWELLVEESEDGKRRLDMYRENIGNMTRWRENWMENAKGVIWKAAGMEEEGEGVDGSVETNKKSD